MQQLGTFLKQNGAQVGFKFVKQTWKNVTKAKFYYEVTALGETSCLTKTSGEPDSETKRPYSDIAEWENMPKPKLIKTLHAFSDNEGAVYFAVSESERLRYITNNCLSLRHIPELDKTYEVDAP